MITLDAIRAAILSEMPWTQLDELVRAELAAGRTTRQIFDDLTPLVDQARATPGMTQDGEEALFGTLDALTGDCHPDCQYKDPPTKMTDGENGIARPEADGSPHPSRNPR